jgi:hypothetical protein
VPSDLCVPSRSRSSPSREMDRARCPPRFEQSRIASATSGVGCMESSARRAGPELVIPGYSHTFVRLRPYTGKAAKLVATGHTLSGSQKTGDARASYLQYRIKRSHQTSRRLRDV